MQILCILMYQQACTQYHHRRHHKLRCPNNPHHLRSHLNASNFHSHLLLLSKACVWGFFLWIIFLIFPFPATSWAFICPFLATALVASTDLDHLRWSFSMKPILYWIQKSFAHWQPFIFSFWLQFLFSSSESQQKKIDFLEIISFLKTIKEEEDTSSSRRTSVLSNKQLSSPLIERERDSLLL